MPSPKKKARRSPAKDNKEEGEGRLAEHVGPCTVYFPSQYDGRDLRLIEVPNEIVDVIGKGESLKIVGDGSKSDAVLCTMNRTYTIKKVETSNQIFLVSGSETSRYPIECGINDYYEVKPIKGRVDQIKSLLEPNQYYGKAEEAETAEAAAGGGMPQEYIPGDDEVEDVPLMTKQEMVSKIQASDGELNSALFALGVVEIDGKMRMLSSKVISEVARELLDTVMVNGWDMAALDEDVCAQNMPTAEPVFLTYVLSTLGSKSKDGDSNLWVLDNNLVAQKTAHILFQNRAAENALSSKDNSFWPQSDFLLEWGSRNPGMGAPSPSLLAGIAVAVEGGKGTGKETKCYTYVPAEEINLLPTPQERFRKLYSIKPKYVIEELDPYCSGLVGGLGQPKSNAELVLKFSRIIESKYYMSK